jgi:hypothetical protein
VVETETRAFFESGCALLVGTVSADGEPHAGRGWGLDVLSEEPLRIRVLLDAEDVATVERAAEGGAIAVTATSVRTLHSVQLKGRATSVEADAGDAARAQRYIAAFFHDIQDTDGTTMDLLDRFVPLGYVGCTVEVEERFDQTPGPAAGAAIGRTSR